jgi:hypothetical protein
VHIAIGGRPIETRSGFSRRICSIRARRDCRTNLGLKADPSDRPLWLKFYRTRRPRRCLGRVLINPVQQPLADVPIFAARCRRVTDGAEPRRHKAFRCADRYASRDQPDFERRVREVLGPSAVDGCSSFDRSGPGIRRIHQARRSAKAVRRRKAGAAMVRSGLECAPCLASRQRPDDSLVVTLGDGRQLVPVLLTRLRYVVQVAEDHPATEAGLMLHH